MNKYIIINNPNEVAVNNAYNELKSLYKSIYRSNDLLAYKLLVNTLENGITNNINNATSDHQVLIDAVNNISYANENLKAWDIYPNDMLFSYDHDVDMTDFTQTVVNALESSQISYTAAHANSCISLESLIDTELDKMFIANSNFKTKEQELKTIISTTLEADPRIDATKYDVSELEPTENYNNRMVAKVQNKIISLLSKNNINIPVSSKFIINVGGSNQDQIAIDKLASEINNLYKQLYNEEEYANASALANQYYQFISTWTEGTSKADALATAGVNENEISTLGTLDDEYIYTAEDIAAIENYKDRQEAIEQQITESNATNQEALTAKLEEYNAAVAAYTENHNGNTYEGTIIALDPKHMPASDNYVDDIKSIITKKNAVIPITEINVSSTDITVQEGESIQIDLSYEPSNYTPFEASEISVVTANDISIDEVAVDHITVTPAESGTISITINDVSVIINITMESQQPTRYYFGTSHEPIVENGVINLSNFTQYTEEEFFNSEHNGYSYHSVNNINENPSNNSVRYILIPSAYDNNITVNSVLNAAWEVTHAWTDGTYTVLDVSEFNNGLGIAADFELKLGGNPFSNNVIIETLEPQEQTEGYYWYVGQTQPTTNSNQSSEGWTALSAKPENGIKIFKDTADSDWSEVQWYLAAPAEWNYVTSVNGTAVGGWDKTTISINNVQYNVWTCQALASSVNVTLANV